MNVRRLFLLGGVLVIGLACLGLRADPPAASSEKKPRKRADAGEPADSKHRVPLAVARDRAGELHAVLESTLHAMHRHYFERDRDRVAVPARAMQDVFWDLARRSHVDAHWIAVNTNAMTLEHEPGDDFEKQAARELAAGKESFERVENGSFRRAAAIVLGDSCLRCHAATSFGPPSRSAKYAALVISVPLRDGE